MYNFWIGNPTNTKTPLLLLLLLFPDTVFFPLYDLALTNKQKQEADT